MGFKEYKKVLDLTALQLNRTADSVFKDRYEMLSVRQLGKAIDSLEKSLTKFQQRSKVELQAYLDFTRYMDTGWMKVTTKAVKATWFKQLMDTNASHSQVLDQSISLANSLKTTLEGSAMEYDSRRKDLRLHLMVWHEKFTMSIAVLVLFLIGAPLGSIVRKGGIGTPVVFAVIFFVIFFLLNNFGKKFVKEDVLQPAAGMWMATVVLVPVGLFLIYKALHDSQLFNKEYYYRIVRAVKKRFAKKSIANSQPVIGTVSRREQPANSGTISR
jgi:lipopolysaccharide export system permease protein